MELRADKARSGSPGHDSPILEESVIAVPLDAGIDISLGGLPPEE